MHIKRLNATRLNFLCTQLFECKKKKKTFRYKRTEQKKREFHATNYYRSVVHMDEHVLVTDYCYHVVFTSRLQRDRI